MRLYFPGTVALMAMLALQPVAQAGVLKDHPGRWLGELKIPDGPILKIGAQLLKRADGSYWASYFQPDQGVYDAPVKSVREVGEAIELDLSSATLKMTWARDHFIGEIKQGDRADRFELKQVQAFPIKLRPQPPKAPYPYRDETLAIASAKGVTLGATLSIPRGKTKPNAVVLAHGSGPLNRDESSAGHQPFAVLADQLARQGIAVLRYDKRGVAHSSGDYENHTGADLAVDLNAVVQALKARKEFKHIGLIGHSEGPGIAAAVAAAHPRSVDFIVSLGGAGLPGLDMMLLQDRATAKVNGATPVEVDQIVNYARSYYDIILTQAEVPPRMAALTALESQRPAAEKAVAAKYKMNEGSLSMAMADKPFLRGILMADTTQNWRLVQCPVLALGGSLDQQVPAQENVGGIVAALKTGGNIKVESAILPSLNHMFQTAKTGAEDEYGRIDETIAPIAVQRIVAFVNQQ